MNTRASLFFRASFVLSMVALAFGFLLGLLKTRHGHAHDLRRQFPFYLLLWRFIRTDAAESFFARFRRAVMNPDHWGAIIVFANAAMALVVSAWAVKLAVAEWPYIAGMLAG